MLVAVAETVSAGAQADARQTRRLGSARQVSRRLSCVSPFSMRCVAFATLVTLGAVPARVLAQVTGAGERAPSVVQTPNGLPQININTPSAAGVSQNTYSQFDVPRGGAILNNASAMTQTQQAGMINGNPNLGPGQSARIILNQVNSTAPSQLRGFLEVAGSRAEVIVANGSGIVVDGGGYEGRALIGEIMTSVAASRGAAGFVVDGAVRDSGALGKGTFPCFARSAIHLGPYKDGPGAINVPVCVGGIVVHPGDIVVGDEDGVVAFPVAGAAELLAAVKAQEAREAEIMLSIRENRYQGAYAR